MPVHEMMNHRHIGKLVKQQSRVDKGISIVLLDFTMTLFGLYERLSFTAGLRASVSFSGLGVFIRKSGLLNGSDCFLEKWKRILRP